MGVLKIKVNNTGNVNTDWKTIDNLSLDNLSLNELKLKNTTTNEYEDIEDKIQNIADNAAVSIYIEVYSKQFTSISGGTYLVYKSNGIPSTSNDGYNSIAAWFNTVEEKEKKQKGFLIEHRTINSNTYHLPYYWNGSAWVLLNAIWG